MSRILKALKQSDSDWEELDGKRESLRKGAERTRATPGSISLEDFYAYSPAHSYIYTPTGEMWAAGSINERIPPRPLLDAHGNPMLDRKGKEVMLSATQWLDRNEPVEQMTWAPGLPMVINNRLILQGGWITRPGVRCFNLYRAPNVEPGDPEGAGIWLDHVRNVFGSDSNHIISWLAHRVQRPMEKINHALVLGGKQGIGKDTMLEPLKYAVGPWNFIEVTPHHMLGRFNGFVKSVILRINEARDLGDVNRFAFYDHMKAYTAAPPDVLRVDEKHLREYSIFNCCGVIITTNHKSDGIYLPADDRRHFVAWSDLDRDDFDSDYWTRIWAYYTAGGIRNVGAYLAQVDIRGFNPKAPPPKTEAFWDIVNASRATEDAEFADVLDALGNPHAVPLSRIVFEAEGKFREWLEDRRNRRVIPDRLEACGYVPVRNDVAKDGLWKLGGKRQVVYGRAELSISDRLKAARKL